MVASIICASSQTIYTSCSMLFVSVLALSVSHSFDSSPKGGALGKTGKFAVLPRPLTLGEVASRSDDGEGEAAKNK